MIRWKRRRLTSSCQVAHRHAAVLGAVLLLTGCAGTAVRENFATVQDETHSHLSADVQWLTTDDARREAQTRVDALLAYPLGVDDAVRIALSYSPAVQALLFDGAVRSAEATRSARLPNPVFSFERLVRLEGGLKELEIGRILAFSLYDLILLPSRLRLADDQQAQTRLWLAGEVAKSAIDVRQAWLRAVAAQQSLAYFEQVRTAADASAELARRMQAAGNFSKLQRAREQAFSAEAVAQLARARQNARGTREALVRLLGLTPVQSTRLILADRLADLPSAPKDEQSVMQTALEQRLDIRLARAKLELLAKQQGLTRIAGFVNGFTVAGVRNTETNKSSQHGYELEFPLPIFDFGDASRLRAEAAYTAALNRTAQLVVDASSQVRETYAAYRTADDLARHYRDEIVPLRKIISEENLLRYNGMLIGVFDLLADAREQIASIVQAIDAQRDYWLADAALQAALIGQPTARLGLEASAQSTSSGERIH
jgi:outer membrane protein TolC